MDPEVAAPAPQAKRRRSFPFALRAIVGLIVVAVAFIGAAVLGGGGSGTSGPIPGTSAPSSAGGAPAASETAARLGYPEFATDNTTRIGGDSPTANAAGVALATYPSTEPSLRPAAVTLIGEDDWQGGIAASVLMAAPVKAPLLISAPEEVPGPTATALAALLPGGSAATDGAQAFAIGKVTAPGDLARVTRLKASGAAGTAAAIEQLRDRLLGTAPSHVIVTSSEQPGFAMPAAAWAARSGDPVLFTTHNELPAATATALKAHPKVPVFVLGPASAISPGVVRQIAKIDGHVRRVSGPNPASNAIALARFSEGSFGWNVNDPGHGFVIARSDSPLDAAAAAPLSASGTWGPLLLTDSAARLPSATRGYLLDVKPGYTTDPTRAFYNHVWVIGDEGAIDVKQQGEIDNLAALAKIGGEP